MMGIDGLDSFLDEEDRLELAKQRRLARMDQRERKAQEVAEERKKLLAKKQKQDLKKTEEGKVTMYFVLWLIAVALVIYGIYVIIKGNVLLGIVLIILGLLVGPGGVSLFDVNNDEDLSPHHLVL